MTVSLVLQSHARDLGGGMIVLRLLPAKGRQGIGPFVFFDHFGPQEERPETNHDVRPHPHIGLATVTYVFEGAMVHCDSLAFVQRIEPSAINWMTAGRGIVHSERRPDDSRALVFEYEPRPAALGRVIDRKQGNRTRVRAHACAGHSPVLYGRRDRADPDWQCFRIDFTRRDIPTHPLRRCGHGARGAWN